jgi:uncharacterized protein YciU (UPF0263 family)
MNADYIWNAREIRENVAYRLTDSQFAELWVAFCDTMDNYGNDLLAEILGEYGDNEEGVGE